jgi:hypothetical protein
MVNIAFTATIAELSGLRAEIRFAMHQFAHRASVCGIATERTAGFCLRSGISIHTCSR